MLADILQCAQNLAAQKTKSFVGGWMPPTATKSWEDFMRPFGARLAMLATISCVVSLSGTEPILT